MATEIKMPQLGESVTEGTISRWLKQPGDQVTQYEALLEVTTDKVDTEVPAPVAGQLLEIKVPEGTTVKVGTVLALVGSAQPTAAVADQYDTEPGTVPAANGTPLAVITDSTSKVRPPVSPVVARMVAEHGLDLNQINGTGVGGRVSKQDVLRYLDQRPTTNDQRPTTDDQRPTASDQRPTTNDQRPTTDDQRPTASDQRPAITSPTMAATTQPIPTTQPTPAPSADTELVPLTAMRRAIAEHMVLSKKTTPHVTNVFEVDLHRIVAHREQHRAAFERQGVRLTYTAYFFQATAAALRAVPYMNGRYSDAGVVLNKRVHIGMAVALQEGLIVPVLRDADEKNLLGLARSVNDLAERARSRRLTPDEVQGGTFTITNHGTGGSLLGTPVINQPQSGILGVGAMVKRPVVITQGGQDLIAIRPMCYLSLTFDHRLIDGSAADAFLTVIKQTLEQYS